MERCDRKLLLWIAVSTTFIATVVACGLIVLIVQLAVTR
jgi:hypothetical protein